VDVHVDVDVDVDVDAALDIRLRIAAVRRRISTACAACGRDPASVTLVGVTKTFPAEVAAAAVAAGLADLGENYAQELGAKAAAVAAMGHSPRWHFIGGLQTNKAKAVLPLVAAIHSVDRPSLLEEIAKRVAPGRTLDVFVEVAIACEAQKSGAHVADVEDLCRLALAVPGLRLRGLMAVPPVADDPEASRPYFAALRDLRDRARAALGTPSGALDDLSMGMSHDLEVAIEEGATFVRVGTALFGCRPPRGSA
jgi:pyridoxal phosphate enzyme (YggS family)